MGAVSPDLAPYGGAGVPILKVLVEGTMAGNSLRNSHRWKRLCNRRSDEAVHWRRTLISQHGHHTVVSTDDDRDRWGSRPAGQKQMGYLLPLCELELIDRERRAAERRLKAAKFPMHKTLETFDFPAQPSVNHLLVTELMRGEYLDKRENILLVGNSGTGKIHLSTALGITAAGNAQAARRILRRNKDPDLRPIQQPHPGEAFAQSATFLLRRALRFLSGVFNTAQCT